MSERGTIDKARVQSLARRVFWSQYGKLHERHPMGLVPLAWVPSILGLSARRVRVLRQSARMREYKLTLADGRTVTIVPLVDLLAMPNASEVGRRGSFGLARKNISDVDNYVKHLRTKTSRH